MNRSLTDNNKLANAKTQSLTRSVTLVLSDNDNREFFRYEDGKCVEYDCTRYFAHNIRLTEEEIASLNG